MNEKQFLLVFFLVLGMLLGSAATLSYVEDPGGAFTKNIKEEDIANILLSGHNVGNVENYDERLLQKDVIKNDRRKIDVIVIGSSRSLQIRSSIFLNKTFFNHGVSGASIEDYIAILYLYQEKENLPQIVIIGVDPWILNTNNGQKRWISLKQEFQNGIVIICSTSMQSDQGSADWVSITYSKYSSLISRPIIIDSLKQVFSQSYFKTDSDELDVVVKLKDGSISYPTNFRTKTKIQIDADAQSYASSNPIYSLGNFTYIDEESKIQFESTIHYLQSRNVTVILLLPPYHPIVYQKFITDPQYSKVRDVESYFRYFASKENIDIIGSYNPNLMNLTSIDFYDGMHPSTETMDKILAGYLSLKPIFGSNFFTRNIFDKSAQACAILAAILDLNSLFSYREHYL